jgi:hypothetical protein
MISKCRMVQRNGGQTNSRMQFPDMELYSESLLQGDVKSYLIQIWPLSLCKLLATIFNWLSPLCDVA